MYPNPEPPVYIRWYWRSVGEEWRVDQYRYQYFEEYIRPYMSLQHWIDPSFFFFAICIAILISLIRFLYSKFLTKVALRFVKDKSQKNIHRFVESVVKASYYGFVWYLELYVLWSQPYFWDMTKLMSREMFLTLTQVPPDILLVYYVQMGWYLQSLFSHFYLDSKKEDHLIMLAHHLLTVTLIFGSLKVSFFLLFVNHFFIFTFTFHFFSNLILYSHQFHNILPQQLSIFSSNFYHHLSPHSVFFRSDIMNMAFSSFFQWIYVMFS
jgi:hypothetical protein